MAKLETKPLEVALDAMLDLGREGQRDCRARRSGRMPADGRG
jgi:hypothetical protein